MAEEPPRGSYAIKYICMYVCNIITVRKLEELFTLSSELPFLADLVF